MSDATPATSYDDVPYPSMPLPQTHPDWLATLAKLSGLQPAPVQRARVMEIACADAGNLVAMAEGLPDSQFTGIDLSASHIDAGKALVQAVGVKNVTLFQQDILHLSQDFGHFDYIIAHGVFSWVPAQVRDSLLAFCQKHLAPDGIAFISYNVFPGWHFRRMFRAMMQYHTRNLTDSAIRVKQSRDLLGFFLQTIPQEGWYRDSFEEERQRLEKTRDSYIFHEHLEDCNEPMYFRDFVAQAARFGLKHFGDADYLTMPEQRLPPALRNMLEQEGLDYTTREQYRDFFVNRMFRQSLLCHADKTPLEKPNPSVMKEMFLASQAVRLSPNQPLYSNLTEEFRGPLGVSASTHHPISKAALVTLTEVWPRYVSFEELGIMARHRLLGDAVVVQKKEDYGHDTQVLIENLFQAFLGGVVELHNYLPSIAPGPGPFPKTSALARYYAAKGNPVPNRRQEVHGLDPLSARFLTLLDGQRDHQALINALVEIVREDGLEVLRNGMPLTDPDRLHFVLSEEMGANLKRLCDQGLLVP
jgi:methyltransferase-like protein/cyclopropane fatty-acyl-phospholipid synthase-like methyltransferase